MPKKSETKHRKKALESLADLGRGIVDDINKAQPPKLKIPSRSTTNIIYDKKNRYYVLGDRFGVRSAGSMKQVKKGALDDLWQKTKVLAPESILATVLLEESFRLLRRELKRATGVNVAFEDFVAGFKKMLNESAGITLEKLNIKPPQAKARKPRAKQAADSEESPDAESQEQVIPPSEPADESAVALPPEAQGQNPPDAPTSP